jgi:hypothetical protein
MTLTIVLAASAFLAFVGWRARGWWLEEYQLLRLRSSDAAVKRRALERLGGLATPRSIPAILEAARWDAAGAEGAASRDCSLAFEPTAWQTLCIRAIVRSRGEAAPPLVEALRAVEDAKPFALIVHVLGVLDRERPVFPLLIAAFEGLEGEAREQVAETYALLYLRDGAGFAAARSAALDPAQMTEVREGCAAVLIKMVWKAVALHDPRAAAEDAGERSAAAEPDAQTKARVERIVKEAASAFAALLEDPAASLRARALEGLGELARFELPSLSRAGWEQALARSLADDDAALRETAAVLLRGRGAVRSKELVAAAARALADPRPNVKEACLVALAGIALDDERFAALRSIFVDALPQLAAALLDPSVTARTLAAEILPRLAPEAVPALVDLYRRAPPGDREGVAMALTRLGPDGEAALAAEQRQR